MTRGVSATLATAIIACLVVLAPASASAFGLLSSFGSFGSAAGQTISPSGIAIAPDGSLYVVEDGNNRVSVFSPDGSFRFGFGRGVNAGGGDVCTAASDCRAGAPTAEAGAMGEPDDIALAASGDVYVADESNNRIDVFSAQGAFRFAFARGVNPTEKSEQCTALSGCEVGLQDGSSGALRSPDGLAISSSGDVYVSNEDGRIDVFSSAGDFRFAFGQEVNPVDNSDRCTISSGCRVARQDGAAGSLDEPNGLAFGPGGELFVADDENARIDVFSAQGDFLFAFGKDVNGSTGSGICTAKTDCRVGDEDGEAGSLEEPLFLEVAGDLFISEDRERVSRFSLDGHFIQAFGGGVRSGAEALEVCDLATGCRGGLTEKSVGSIPGPTGVAVDCRGAIYVAQAPSSAFGRIDRFGEAATPPAPCLAAAPAPAAPSNRFKFGRVKLNRERGTATLLVRVPGPGALTLVGKGVRRAKATAKRAGAVKLAVKPVGKAKRTLLRTAKVKVRFKVTFKPRGGVALTKSKALTLRAALGR